jgi:hypothetical protein
MGAAPAENEELGVSTNAGAASGADWGWRSIHGS